jgi:hypothetical protein
MIPHTPLDKDLMLIITSTESEWSSFSLYGRGYYINSNKTSKFYGCILCSKWDIIKGGTVTKFMCSIDDIHTDEDFDNKFINDKKD